MNMFYRDKYIYFKNPHFLAYVQEYCNLQEHCNSVNFKYCLKLKVCSD